MQSLLLGDDGRRSANISPRKKHISPHIRLLIQLSCYNEEKSKGLVYMKKFLIIFIILAAVVGAAWFLLLRPETISQETLTQDFETHRKAYDDIALYLKGHNITTEITDIPMAGKSYDGVAYEDSDEYRAFMNGIYVIMEEDHDAIISDGKTVEFVYHSTGGKLRKLYGSVIYNGEKKVEGKVTVPLTTDGWHLYLAQG
jgi:hypothetical protein